MYEGGVGCLLKFSFCWEPDTGTDPHRLCPVPQTLFADVTCCTPRQGALSCPPHPHRALGSWQSKLPRRQRLSPGSPEGIPGDPLSQGLSVWSCCSPGPPPAPGPTSSAFSLLSWAGGLAGHSRAPCPWKCPGDEAQSGRKRGASLLGVS